MKEEEERLNLKIFTTRMRKGKQRMERRKEKKIKASKKKIDM